MIPFVISVAYPHYKRPRVQQEFGVIEEINLQTHLLHKICRFIFKFNNSIQCRKDVDSFFEDYYTECYIDNPPWDVSAFVNGKWINMVPSNDSIWTHMKKYNYVDSENENNKTMAPSNDSIQNL